jgi:hypothetical protein
MTATSRPDCPRHPGSSSSGQRDEHMLKSPPVIVDGCELSVAASRGSQDLGATRRTGIEDLTVSPRRVPASSWRRRPTATVPLAPGRDVGLTADATSCLQSCFRRSTSIPADWASDSLSADLADVEARFRPVSQPRTRAPRKPRISGLSAPADRCVSETAGGISSP